MSLLYSINCTTKKMTRKRKQATQSKTKKSNNKNTPKRKEVNIEDENPEQEQIVMDFLQANCFDNFVNLEQQKKPKVRSFDDFCDMLSRTIQNKRRKKERQIVPGLIRALPSEIIAFNIVPFLDLESVLSGSVFMVCRAWYDGLIENETLWKHLFGRLWDLTIENCKSWNGTWPTEYNSNDPFVREIKRTTRFTTRPKVTFKK